MKFQQQEGIDITLSNSFNQSKNQKINTADCFQNDSEMMFAQNENTKFEEKIHQLRNYSSYIEPAQDQSELNCYVTDMRNGDETRQQWINEIFERKNAPQSVTSCSVYDQNNASNYKQQQTNDIVLRFIKSNDYNDFTPDGTELPKLGNDFSNENMSYVLRNQTKNYEVNELTVKSKPLVNRSGRLSHRFKVDDFQFDSSTKKKRNIKEFQDIGTKLDSQDSLNLEASGRNPSQFKKKVQRSPHQVWITGFFNILIFFNRFIYRNKLKLIHFRPHDLLDNQFHAINDLASYNNHEGENKQQIKDNIFRSQYKIVRKLRILYLIYRKKFKTCSYPVTIFFKKVQNVFKQVLDPIPVIFPFYKISLLWDLISVIFILINVFKIPFEIAYTNGERINQHITQFSRIHFLLNFLMTINTAYYENGVLQKNRSKIFFNFLKKKLILEVLAYICLWVSPFGIMFMRLIFLIKFISFYDIVEKLAESIQLSDKYSFIVNLITLVVEITFLCHLFACIWFIIGDYQQQNNLTPNWISSYNLANTSIESQYVSSLYFSVVTIGTIGFGDIVAKSNLEKSFISAMAVLSCGIFAYILSNVQNLYREYNQKQDNYLNNLSELNNYMFSREVNPNLQQMARKYLKYVHEQNFKKGVLPSETLNVLSKFLREEIVEEIFKRSINCIPFLKNFSPQFQHALAIKMKEINYGPDEIIMKAGSYQTPFLYYILKGSVEVSLDQGSQKSCQFNTFYEKNPFYLHGQNEVFGQYEFISQCHQSITNAKSLEITTIHQLSLNDFIEVINQFTIDKEKYLEMKDKINLYQNYSCVKVFCYSCKSSQHLIKDCPIFFYKPTKQRIVNSYNREQDSMKKEIQRGTNRLILNALAFQYEIEDDCIFFRENNQSELGSLIQLEEDEESAKKAKTKKTLNEISPQTMNNLNQLDKPNISRLSATISRLSQTQSQTNNILETPKIIEEKEEEPKQEKNKRNTRSLQSITEKRSKNSISTFSSTSSSSSSLSESDKKQKKENKDDQNQIKQNFQSQISTFDGAIHRKSFNRINSKQEFTRKATLLAARTKKNWNKDDKNNPEENNQVQIPVYQQQPRPSQAAISHRDSKSYNNLASKNMKRAITIGQMQNVLEYMNMVNAQKAMKQQYQPVDDVVTETVRTFKIYMIHNNVNIVLQLYNNLLKIKTKKKRVKATREIASPLRGKSSRQQEIK